MAPLEHYQPIADFQKLRSFDGIYSSFVCGTFRIARNGKVHCFQATHVVVLIVVARVSQGAAECFINASQRYIRICDLIHSHTKLFVQIVFKARVVI